MADNNSAGIDSMVDTAKALFADDKGLLAMDESNGTCNKRFARWGIPKTPESRREYRELIITTPRLGESIGGAILYDETIRQRTKDGTSFVAALVESGIVPGIKVDLGAARARATRTAPRLRLQVDPRPVGRESSSVVPFLAFLDMSPAPRIMPSPKRSPTCFMTSDSFTPRPRLPKFQLFWTGLISRAKPSP